MIRMAWLHIIHFVFFVWIYSTACCLELRNLLWFTESHFLASHCSRVPSVGGAVGVGANNAMRNNRILKWAAINRDDKPIGKWIDKEKRLEHSSSVEWCCHLSAGRQDGRLYPSTSTADTWSESLIEMGYLLHLWCRQKSLINSVRSFVFVNAFFNRDQPELSHYL